MLFSSKPFFFAFVLLFAAMSGSVPAETSWNAGLAKVEITPVEAVRLSGYGNRDRPSEGVDTALFARAVCLQPTTDGQTGELLVLISVDNIGLSGANSKRLAATLHSQHGIERERIAFCSTHTHSGPDLNSQLSNIFAAPLSNAESAAAARYSQQLDQAVVRAVSLAIEDLKPAQLAHGMGQAGFAVNRRVLVDGKWSGFGVQADGPVDHTVSVLRISGNDGTIRGLLFNYACHCTTVGGDYYKVNADWAGYAATDLENAFPAAVALCTIGCGADANPNPRGSVEMAQMHGQELATEIKKVAKSDLAKVDEPVAARFDYAALSFELPTREELESRLAESSQQTRRHAERMIKTYEEKGRLPATYPVPIQSWKFGDQLTMVFLGGEVVVDYALRLKKVFADPGLWVTAYANDVLGYIASERMREEGGYEFDRSGIYYGLPGPWASGTEDLLIRRVTELVNSSGRARPRSAEDALSTLHTHPSFQIELVASEPLVQDPVNLAFGDDGRLWVVEMGDYPEGTDGGRVKVLSDTDGDGRFDQATTFLAGLAFPTGVQPWRDGVLISAAPDILFAKDTNGDGQADNVQKLYTGFRLANPQHRINGFTYGLDHSLHLASGDNLSEVESVTTGQKVNASGHDVQIWPDEGRIGITSGRTQFVRSRDSFGRWFGNNNSLPMFHFPIEDRYFRRNRAISYSASSQQLFTPAVAPPVFPLTAATERFNDLFAANRFTSACSSIIAQSPHYADDQSSDDSTTAFICEPVHNLVHRAKLTADGATFRAERFESEQDREFLASTDPWFRPVRAAIGPDGMLYIVDMYREVIEHPEWIPDAWQERLDLRAGEQLGRVYRIRPTELNPVEIPVLDRMSDQELVDQLASPNGTLRDQAQRILIHRGGESVLPVLRSLAQDNSNPFARTHALSILTVMGKLDAPTLADALSDPHPGVLLVAIGLAEDRLAESSELLERMVPLSEHPDASVAMQAALALGQSSSPAAGQALATIALRPDLDRWMADAVASSATEHTVAIAEAIFQQAGDDSNNLSAARIDLLRRVLTTARQQGTSIDSLAGDRLAAPEINFDTRMQLAECVVAAARETKTELSSLSNVLGPLAEKAQRIAADSVQPESMRCRAIRLVSLNLNDRDDHTDFLFSLLTPATPVSVQCEAIDGLLETRDAEVLQTIFQGWPSYSITVRDHLVSRLLGRRETAEKLLEELANQTVRVNELSLSARSQLLKSGTRSMRVQAARLINNGGSKERDAIVREYLAQFKSLTDQSDAAIKAELELGQTLFKKHCATCHSAGQSGVAIGASLDNLSNRSDEALVESILDPNRAVEPKYQSYVVLTDDGQTLSGVIESEVADSLTIAHVDGKRTTIRRDTIETLKSSGTSLMPDGFETILKPAELQAIVRVLQSRKPLP